MRIYYETVHSIFKIVLTSENSGFLFFKCLKMPIFTFSWRVTSEAEVVWCWTTKSFRNMFVVCGCVYRMSRINMSDHSLPTISLQLVSFNHESNSDLSLAREIALTYPFYNGDVYCFGKVVLTKASPHQKTLNLDHIGRPSWTTFLSFSYEDFFFLRTSYLVFILYYIESTLSENLENFSKTFNKR